MLVVTANLILTNESVGKVSFYLTLVGTNII